VGEDGHEVVQNARNLTKQGTDELGTLRDLDVQELLDGQGETLLIGHHGDVVETVEVGERLEVGLVLDELLGAAVQQTDMGIGANNLLAIDLENQTQHAVSGGMLGTEVDGVVPDLPVLDRDLNVAIEGRGVVRVGRAAEVGVNGNKPRGLVVGGGLGVASEACRRELTASDRGTGDGRAQA
jgi:hypothetical protein